MPNSLSLDDLLAKYGEPLHVGSKHLVWKDAEQNRAIKMTRPGYLADGSCVVVSQRWHEPADPAFPHPSAEEVAGCMRAFGFRQVSLEDWQRVDGIIARNVKPGDFVKTKDGVVPVDLWLDDPNKRG